MTEARLIKKIKGKWHDLFTDKKSGKATWSKSVANSIVQAMNVHAGMSAAVVQVSPTRWAVYYRHKYLAFDNIEKLIGKRG